jgi:hypothetical protein
MLGNGFTASDGRLCDSRAGGRGAQTPLTHDDIQAVLRYAADENWTSQSCVPCVQPDMTCAPFARSRGPFEWEPTTFAGSRTRYARSTTPLRSVPVPLPGDEAIRADAVAARTQRAPRAPVARSLAPDLRPGEAASAKLGDAARVARDLTRLVQPSSPADQALPNHS